MSATLLGFLAALISASCLALLAASDSKRLAGRRSALGNLRHPAIVVALLPGALLPLTGHWVAFFIWLGTATVLGWTIAAVFSAFRPDNNSGIGGRSGQKPDQS